MKKEDPTEPVFDESINKALSRRGFIHGMGGIGALIRINRQVNGCRSTPRCGRKYYPRF